MIKKFDPLHSRARLIDVQKCVENSTGNQYELILLAAKRARAIANDMNRNHPETAHCAAVQSLLEIQEFKND